MADNSLPEGDAGNAGAENSALPDNQPNQSAEQRQDAVSTETGNENNGAPQDGSPQQGDGGNEESDDDGLAKFAESRGYDISEMSDREKALLKDVRENQRYARENAARKGSEDMNKVENEIYQPHVDEDADEYERREAERDYKLNLLTAAQRKRDFFDEVPDAKQYESDMAQYIADEAQRNGVDAARYLASDLRRVYVLVKDAKGGDEVRQASEAARREERELLRQKQEAGAGTPAASSTQSRQSPKVTRDWVSNEYDPSNAEHRKMLDEAIARGDLY